MPSTHVISCGATGTALVAGPELRCERPPPGGGGEAAGSNAWQR